MKQTVYYLFLAGILLLLAGCGKADAEMPTRETIPETQAIPENSESTPENRILVAYFSCTGNTQNLAEAAAKYLNADVYEIEAAVPYTDADIAYYTGCRADKEQDDPDSRPEIAGRVENMEQYDTVVLGYPIWHGQAPRIISTFLESYDFSGKTILPFCTSQSSGIGNSDKNLHALCNARWKDGKRFTGDAKISEFTAWLSENIEPEEAATMGKNLTLMVNNTVIPVIWEKNASAAELAEIAADKVICIPMSMYGGWEQVGSLGCSIRSNDVQLTADIGDIMLYSGNQLVLFYGSNTWEYTKLGHINLPENEITALLSNEAVTITLEIQ